MKKLSLLLVASIFTLGLLKAQDDAEATPVRFAFEGSHLLNHPTTEKPYKGSLQFQIQHRFGLVENGISDIFGIYGSANTRLELGYGITDNITIAAATTQEYKLQELNWKYTFLKQTTSNSVPVTMSYYGNWVLDAREKSNFGNPDSYRFIHRLSYYTELIVSHKFSDAVSLQAAPNFIYFNAVDSGVNNIHYGFSVSGRAKILPSLGIIAEYDQLLSSNDVVDVKPNLSIGVEIGTATHAFQIFLQNYNSIVQQRNFVFNTNDFGNGDFLFGFNIIARL